jgi:predicted alpha-1,2-mannosidase
MLEFKMPRTHRKKSLVVLAIVLLVIELILSLFINLIRGRTQSTLTYFLASPHTNYAALVDPFTGTSVQNGAPFGGGDTFPGADVPSGMVQWSPDTVNPLPGGYAYNDHRIKGFSLTHLSGAGCATYQDFPFTPYVGAVTSSPATDAARYTATFSHANETAYAGYYQVKLDNGVTTELTTTPRTGAARFTYPAGQTATLLLNTSGSVNGVSHAHAQVSADSISGFATSDGFFCHARTHYTIYFFARFSQRFASYGTWHDRTIAPRSTSVSDNRSGVYVTFDTSTTNVITASVGISFVSIANAQENLDSEDASGNFDAVLAQATKSWNMALDQIQVSGGTLSQASTFYTALYHALLYPSVFSDENGQYIGFDNKIHTVAPGHSQYANYSGWDIYRSEAQLLAFLEPDRASDMAQSLVNDYTQSGKLPRWSLANQSLSEMVGDPADAIIADIYAFGGTHFATSTALAAMIQQATKPNGMRRGLNYLVSKGYLPMDGSYNCCGLWGQAAISLEYDVDDFSIGSLAQALGDTKDYQRFVNRAQDWKNLVNPRDHYLEPRSANGSFLPHYSLTSGLGWIEGDGAQYTWMVQFNLNELFQASGGNKAVISRLNTFFTHFNGGPGSPYAFMGNEPSLEVPWEYDYAGAPYRTQAVVRAIENTLYTTGTGGLDGNDDLGEMSSWYVWAALGMYPETPGTANLILSSPLFPRITITRQSGQTITIAAPHASADTYYVQSLTVNGAAWNAPWLPSPFITSGGTLNYTLSTTANTSWGADITHAPPSYGSIPNSSLAVWPTYIRGNSKS